MKPKDFKIINILGDIYTFCIILICVLCVVLVVKGCSKASEEIRKTNKSVFQLMGEGVKKIQDDFNKGYKGSNK